MTSQSLALKFIKRFVCILFLLSLLSIFMVSSLPAAHENSFNTLLPSFPASYTESSFAPLINPVFSDINSGPSASYIFQNLDYKKNANHYFLADYLGFFFSYSRIDNVINYHDSSTMHADTNLFTIGKGFFFGNTFGFGANYSFSQSDDKNFDDYKSLTLGLLWRPSTFLSLGYVARDINNPRINGKEAGRTDVYSLSIRPFKFFTLSADALKSQHRKFQKSNLLLSANLAFKYDIQAYASINKDRDFTFGLAIPFGIGGSSLILDGYTANISDFSSSALGMTLTGDKTRSSIVQSRRFLRIHMDGEVGEVKTESLLGVASTLAFYDLVNAVDKAKYDDSIAGIILVIDEVGLGFAQMQEFREQLKIFKTGNKGVYAILNVYGNKEYYLASACTKIYYNPANLFALTGLSAEIYFFKEGLDKIGVKFESIKRGLYKSFAEPYTREHMSPEFRENMTSLVSDLNEQYLSDISNDRLISRDRINELLSKGGLEPDEALSRGFIDSIDYPMEAERKIIGDNNVLNFIVGLDDYIDEKVRERMWGSKPEITIIHVSGSIIQGKSADFSYLTGQTTGDETYLEALNDAFKSSTVKAVVIRIDSGGGSSLASELMWHYLMELKREYNKPVIFSFGNTAASGGYYIACTGDRIFGSRGTITGSIGVVTGKLSLKELYKKLGINKDIIKMSEFADIFSEAKDLTPEERRIIEEGVDYVYKRFTERVMESRGIIKDRIDKVAEGRVFTGSQGKNNQLTDELGGLIASIGLAKKMANIRNEYNIKHLPEISVPIIKLLGLNTMDTLLSQKLKTFLQTLEIVKFKDELALYYCPYKIVIK